MLPIFGASPLLLFVSPSPSLRFPLLREPERGGEAPLRGRCPAVTMGGGSARRAGLTGNWKVKLCGELEGGARVGVGADAAAPGLCGQCSAACPCSAEERRGPQRPALVPESWSRPGAVPGRAMEDSEQEPHDRQPQGGASGEGTPGNAGREGWVWCWYFVVLVL